MSWRDGGEHFSELQFGGGGGLEGRGPLWCAGAQGDTSLCIHKAIKEGH